MVLQVPLFKLQCGVNSYEWGKKGEDSAAARFAATTPAEGFTVQSDKPYAELWMGTHPSNPSKDLQSGRTLLDLVQENQQLLSAPVSSKYGSKLPFLFKVLSINKALSIQAHPNKKLAEQLHARDPKNYPDDNHKPEMAIAITPFEGLCGFRPLAEISHFLNTVPPLKALVKEDKADEFINTVKGEEETESAEIKEKNKTALQHVFASLLSATTEEIQKRHGEFGADIGLFVLFFLNYVKMEPGEAMFLVADDIHAYLSGDIIECMAASDNVVRAGFTPKFKDVPTLVDMLTYNYAPIDEQKMSPSEYPYATLNRTAYSSGSAVILYDPPIDEFSVVRSLLKGDGSKATFDPLEGPSIIICTSGKGTIAVGPKVEKISEGNVFFVGSTAEVVLQSEGDADDEFITFKAFCEIEERAEEKL
uniref:Mannose-6-phosphate isomerase n=1 Tax=Colletotrichum fructicola (strain Nara gc5) TaxID=1213859 RepID=L2FQQ1_COLFN